MDYRAGDTYKALVKILRNAGIKIDYLDISDDVYGRADPEGLIIQMPADPEAYKEKGDDYATMILGHEAAHILSDPYVVDPGRRRGYDTKVNNEALCDLIGVYLYRLADLTVAEMIETELRDIAESTDLQTGKHDLEVMNGDGYYNDEWQYVSYGRNLD